MTEVEALIYAIKHLKDSIVANPALGMAGAAPKAVAKLESMLKKEVGMKRVADAIQNTTNRGR